MSEQTTAPAPPHTLDQFIARWKRSSAYERSNYAIFLVELCDQLGVARPDPATMIPEDDAYVLDRPISFTDLSGKETTNFADLYKRGCFVLEAKQGSDDDAGDNEAKALGASAKKHRRGTAKRGTQGWDTTMLAARAQAERYVRALDPSERNPPFLIVADVGHSFDLFVDFSRSGKNYLPFSQCPHQPDHAGGSLPPAPTGILWSRQSSAPYGVTEMKFEPNTFVPTALWNLEETIEDRGTATVSLKHIPVAILGTAKVTVSESGECRIHIEISDRGPIPLGLSHEEFEAYFTDVQISQIAVSTSQGTYTTRGYIRTFFWWDRELTVRAIEAIPSETTFVVDTSEPAVYWLAPLFNLLALYLEHPPNLINHPLRFYNEDSLARDLSSAGASYFPFFKDEYCGVVPFTYNDRPAFIQALPNHDERREEILNGKRSFITTATIVGEVGSQDVDSIDIDKQFNYGFTSVLSLTNGRRVRPQWVEFRDGSGRLVQRVFHRWSEPKYIRGRSVLPSGTYYLAAKGEQCGLGNLLTCATQSPLFGELFIMVATMRIVRSNREGETLEDQFDQACRAIETLYKVTGTTFRHLLDDLREATSQQVTMELRKAAHALKALAANAIHDGEHVEARALELLAHRVTSDVKDVPIKSSFGTKLSYLMTWSRFADEQVLATNQWQSTIFADSSWSAVIARYRNMVTHDGYFTVADDQKHEELQIKKHVCDIAIRILLRAWGYEGLYNPNILDKDDLRLVNWLTCTATLKDLGYQ